MSSVGRIALFCACSVFVWVGCVVESTSSRGAGGAPEDATSTSTSSTGGGNSGSGGGGSSTASGTSGSGGTTGDGGGGGGCVGPDGTGMTVSACDTMNITPASAGGAAASICNPDGGTDGDQDPWGYGACQLGFDIYTAGSAENFQACLATISVAPADACDMAQVKACVEKVYAEACANDDADASCSAFASACGQDPFDAAACREDLKPMNATAIQQWIDCVNANTVDPCQTVADGCFATLTGN